MLVLFALFSDSLVEKSVVPAWGCVLFLEGCAEVSYYYYNHTTSPDDAVFWRRMTRGFETMRDIAFTCAVTISVMYVYRKWRERDEKRNNNTHSSHSLHPPGIQQSIRPR
ncbi:hypothetical protein DRQ20_04600 [bacterium]|nr:MAG: hypothetical protein DRQ20_04600 [bacterium]